MLQFARPSSRRLVHLSLPYSRHFWSPHFLVDIFRPMSMLYLMLASLTMSVLWSLYSALPLLLLLLLLLPQLLLLLLPLLLLLSFLLCIFHGGLGSLVLTNFLVRWGLDLYVRMGLFSIYFLICSWSECREEQLLALFWILFLLLNSIRWRMLVYRPFACHFQLCFLHSLVLLSLRISLFSLFCW